MDAPERTIDFFLGQRLFAYVGVRSGLEDSGARLSEHMCSATSVQ